MRWCIFVSIGYLIRHLQNCCIWGNVKPLGLNHYPTKPVLFASDQHMFVVWIRSFRFYCNFDIHQDNLQHNWAVIVRLLHLRSVKIRFVCISAQYKQNPLCPYTCNRGQDANLDNILEVQYHNTCTLIKPKMMPHIMCKTSFLNNVINSFV